MRYEVLLHPKANDFLVGSEKEIENRIREKLKILRSNPKKGKKLKPSDFWRLRIGDYRVIYEIDHRNNRVTILFIGPRKHVYDDFSRLLLIFLSRTCLPHLLSYQLLQEQTLRLPTATLPWLIGLGHIQFSTLISQ